MSSSAPQSAALSGKTAIITGSNSGIGLGVARSLAQAGADVVLNSFTDRDEDHALAAGIGAEFGVTARYIQADMSKAGDCRALIEKAGACDILVNNAGIQHVAPIDQFPQDKWDAIIAINMNSAFHTTAAALPKMREAGWGRVINISSRAYLGNPGQTNYAAAKAGIIGFTRALGMEQGRFNVTVNAIAPGFVATKMIESLPNYDRIKSRALAMNTVQRLGNERDIANGVVFLASDAAEYISGETLHITGGRYG